MGAAFAAGTVLRGHVDVAVRTHRDLGPQVREEIVPLDIDPATKVVPEDSRYGRRIEAMDTLLTGESQQLSVDDLDALARSLVAELNPEEPAGAHERRFLYARPPGRRGGAQVRVRRHPGRPDPGRARRQERAPPPAWQSTRTASNTSCATTATSGSGTSTPSPTASPSAPPAPASPTPERGHPARPRTLARHLRPDR